MDISSEKAVKKKLQEQHNKIGSKYDKDSHYDRFVFTNCRNIKPKKVFIWTNPRSLDWQVGFFDAGGEVYFDQIVLRSSASFSSIVRNYWWNGKKGEEKKEGYYSLIKSVKELAINKKHASDLINYMEGRYKAGEHWQLHELDRNVELRIYSELEETTIERLSKQFDNIWCDTITADLKIENNITYSCDWYKFVHCKGVAPEKLVINTVVDYINFQNADNEVCIPEIVIEKKADLKSIIRNNYGEYRRKGYSLLSYIQTLVIRSNPKVLCDLADYINGRYKINDDDDDDNDDGGDNNDDSFSRFRFIFGNNNNWDLYKLNKNIKVMIESPGIAFCTVKEIQGYFVDVLVDNNKPEQYLARQQPYQKWFQEHFDKYDLETDQIENFILASQRLKLEDEEFNVVDSSRKISRLYVNQKLALQQFICFHETNKPVVADKIVIESSGDLRCVLQNSYYNGTDSRFFSLLQTAKELTIRNYQNEDSQVLEDFADYIEGKYVLNENWKREELDRDMRIEICDCRYDQLLSVIQRLKSYFKNISIDRIYTPLQTENIVNQECRDKYIFVDSRKANPKKLIINAKLMGTWGLIQFNDADDEVHIPEITIDEQGRFDSIVRNEWQNNKEGDEKKSILYSLVQHVETLTIRNNPGALKDLADYVVRKYVIENNYWELQQLSKDIKIVIENPGDAFLHVLGKSKYFQSVVVDGKQATDYIQIIEQEELKNPDYKAFKTCFEEYDLRVHPFQCGIEFLKWLELTGYVYNIKKSMASINSLTVRQKLDINQFVCFHDIDKAVTVDEIIINWFGDLRSVLQNAYYNNGQSGFFSLLETSKRLKIHNNGQSAEDLADYIDGKYALHPKWKKQALDKDMEIKISVVNSPDVARRLRNYFMNISIDYICTPLRTENIIDQECENEYVFSNCRKASPQKLVVNAKLISYGNLILFGDVDNEVCIPEIMIGEHGSFEAIVRNQWQNYKNGDKRRGGYYNLVSHVETLTIQNNPEVVCNLDRYVSKDYWARNYEQKVQKPNKNIIVRINGVKGLDEQINRLQKYFGYIVIDGRKALGNQHREALANIQLDSNKIQQQSTANADKRSTIARADAEIAETRRRIERARARLGRRRARFQEYLALAE